MSVKHCMPFHRIQDIDARFDVGRVKNDGDPRVNLGTPVAHPAIAWHMRRIFGTGEATDRS